MRLVVCPASSIAEVCRASRPSHVLTLASPAEPCPSLDGALDRLVLRFNDIAEPCPGLTPPDGTAIARVLGFGRAWPGSSPLVVSCAMGVSRSTAAAFILACDRDPDRPERAVAAALRAVSPIATPNPLMVSLADAALGRNGRMVAAIRAIGRGADWAAYMSFGLEVSCPARA